METSFAKLVLVAFYFSKALSHLSLCVFRFPSGMTQWACTKHISGIKTLRYAS